MKLLIDGDGIGYRCAFAVESNQYLVLDGHGRFRIFPNAREAREFEAGAGGPCTVWSRKEIEPLENALRLVDNVVESIYTKYDTNVSGIYLTPSVGNFRESIATVAKYKGNREATPRPTYYKPVFEHLVTKHGATYATGEEADDLIGRSATEHPNAVIVSFDKDLLQIAGRHYNWVTREEVDVTKAQAKRAFYAQAISGDATDNVPGAGGWGTAKASKAVSEIKSDKGAWAVVLKIYEGVYGSEEGQRRALETARLVYVRRRKDELWEPPT